MKHPSDNTETHLDIVELTKLIQLTLKNKKLLIAFFITGLTSGVLIEYKKSQDPPTYEAKLLIELARDKNNKYIENDNNLKYLLKKYFNVNIVNIVTTQIYELSTKSKSPEEASKSIDNAFSFIIKRQDESANYITVLMPTKKIGQISFDTVSKRALLAKSLLVFKVTILSILLFFLILLITNTYRKVRFALNNSSD